MIKVNKDNIVQIIAKDFKRIYCTKEVWRTLANGTSTKGTYKKISACQTVAEVNEIIDRSWTEIHCGECNQFVDEAVRFDNLEDYRVANFKDFERITLCLDCLNKAVKL